jgi:hypothetical protein
MLPSYPKVYALGHAAISGIFSDVVSVEEKVDGSQFSFGIVDGDLQCRSRGKDQTDAPDDLFKPAVRTARELADAGLLVPGWVYRGETLAKPKHNTLKYDRVPDRNIILYDVTTGEESYLEPHEKQKSAERLGLECVPVLHVGTVESLDELHEFMSRTSVLGGCKAEGIVCKSRTLFCRDGKAMMGKLVSDAFKEVHHKEFKRGSQEKGEILQFLCDRYRAEGRWAKAVQHLTEAGQLNNEPRDIPALIKEVQRDITEECTEEIRDRLFKWAWPHISRAATKGFPEWYKARIAASMFEGDDQ